MRKPCASRKPDLIGKGIIYAVNQRHAAVLTQALNEAASARWPGVYHSDFAVQVTSHVYDANIFGEQFKHNSLSGQHPEMPGYATSKTRVCVTVAHDDYRVRLPRPAEHRGVPAHQVAGGFHADQGPGHPAVRLPRQLHRPAGAGAN